MYIRPLITLFLVLSLSIATMGRVPVYQDESSNQAEKAELTPDEEREARALVEEFVTRLESSEDVTPLVKDLYVEDFTERLRAEMNGNFPLAASPEVAAMMSSDEILHAYAASINCLYMSTLLYMAVLRKHLVERKNRSESEGSTKERELTIEEIIPPNLIKLIQSDPALAALLSKVLKEEKEELRTKQDDAETEGSPTVESARYENSQEDSSVEDLIPFKSLEQMRHYTSMAEQGVALLREYIKSITTEPRPSVRQTWRNLMKETTEDVDENEETIKPRLNIQTDEYMGYSAGTRIISAYVLMFHIDMVRASDGRLKVLHCYLVID